MRNETARREIESLDYYLQNHTNDYSEESHTAMMMAIKALEQEPCEDANANQHNSNALNDVGQHINALEVDAISRKALISHIENQSREWGEDYDVQQILGDIEDMPPVKPQEPKTGHWIKYGKLYQCSECKELSCCQGKFCNECGTKMVEPQERSDKE